MNVLVMGATGSVGRLVVEQALARGHHVTALVRHPGKLGALAVRAVAGDALDPAAISHAVAGQDAVIYVLGAGNVRHTTLFSESTRILLKAMTEQKVRRLICVTGVGAGETKGHGGFLYDRIFFPLFTKHIYADKDVQERLIRESGLGLDPRAARLIPPAHAAGPASRCRGCRRRHADAHLAPRGRPVPGR